MSNMVSNKRGSLKLWLVLILVTIALFSLSSVLFIEKAEANTGEILRRDYYGTSASWYNTSYTSLPLPAGFEPIDFYNSPYIYIVNPSTGEVLRRHYNNTSWDNSSFTSVPLPAGFKPIGFYDGYNYYFCIINPSTGEILQKTYNNTSWDNSNFTSVPLPAGFKPIGSYYGYKYYFGIINPSTGEILRREYYDTSWNNSNFTSVPLPAGFKPIGIDDRYLYIIHTNENPTVTLSSPEQNGIYSEDPENCTLEISGTVNDANVDDALTVKYTINGLNNYTNITIATLTANGGNQPFSHDITINSAIPEGTHTLRVWAQDNEGGMSTQVTRIFTVDKSSIGSDGESLIRAITAEEKAYNVDPDTGSYTDVTSGTLGNSFGSNKPFFNREYTYYFNNVQSIFYDWGSTATYIGNNTIRVVTSEEKAFDVDMETGDYTDITSTFLVDNFGQGRPFFHRTYEQKINGSGPFTFHDFGSTMAYIGNNIIRVVTSEGKAFDVNKDNGRYTEITSSFLVNNWGSGKPFYLREYTHNISGESNTFYDFGSIMTYLGNDIIRVVTSQGKAFDVHKDTGNYTEVTSSFMLGNYGTANRPFLNKTYAASINNSTYIFYDFESTMFFTDAQVPSLIITSPDVQAAFDTITLTGTVCDTDGDDVTVSSTLAGVIKSVVVSNTLTPQPWTLEWDIDTDNIPDGIYTNIAVQQDDGNGEVCTAYYQGNICVFGPGSNVARKDIIYEYDDNGKLNRRSSITYP